MLLQVCRRVTVQSFETGSHAASVGGRAMHQSQATPWNPLSCLCSGYANCLLASPKHVSDKGIERVHREASGAWSEEVRLTVVDPTGRREDAG